MKKFISVISLLLCAALLFCSCGTKHESKNNDSEAWVNSEADDETTSSNNRTKIKFTMESGDTFTMELYPEYAPKTCEHFLSLVEGGFYTGLVFHRVVDDFMAQAGGQDAEGNARETDSIEGEFSSNGYALNKLSHTRGVVSMARTNDPDSASGQFFICYGDATFLDGEYAAFAKVTDGMEVIDSFTEVERTYNGYDSSPASPVEPIVIAGAEVIE